MDLDEEREPGSSELEDVSADPETVQPSSTEPELTEISETEETTREAGDGIVDGDCYTHEIMLLGQCVVMCGKEILRFCGQNFIFTLFRFNTFYDICLSQDM